MGAGKQRRRLSPRAVILSAAKDRPVVRRRIGPWRRDPSLRSGCQWVKGTSEGSARGAAKDRPVAPRSLAPLGITTCYGPVRPKVSNSGCAGRTAPASLATVTAMIRIRSLCGRVIVVAPAGMSIGYAKRYEYA